MTPPPESTPPATVAPVAWAVVDAAGAFWDAAPLSSKEYADKRAAVLNRTRDGYPTPYTVKALYAADVPALMALLKEATDLIDWANPGAFKNGVTTDSGDMDEGEVRVSEFVQRARAALGREGA